MRVVVAEDSGLLRAALSGLLTDAGIEVIATVGDGEQLLRVLAHREVDACILDVRMPPTFSDEGLRAALVIRATWPQVGLLVLSQYVEERYAVELLSSGVKGIGYLLKDRVTDADEFITALTRVADGGTALDPEVVAQLLARTRHHSPLDRLSPRERDVLAEMAQGHSNAGIGQTLSIGESAVEKHITAIFTKLDLGPFEGHRRVQAVLRYLEQR